MADSSFDVVIIGGGPGGYPAAIRASQLGLRAAVVEREHLGGICLNWGCIPTKALLRASELHHQIQEAEEFGLTVEGVSFDFSKLVARSRRVAKRLSGGVKQLLKKNEVTVFDGHGRFYGAGRVRVEKEGAEVAQLEARNIILATGARARVMPGFEPDGEAVWHER